MSCAIAHEAFWHARGLLIWNLFGSVSDGAILCAHHGQSFNQEAPHPAFLWVDVHFLLNHLCSSASLLPSSLLSLPWITPSLPVSSAPPLQLPGGGGGHAAVGQTAEPSAGVAAPGPGALGEPGRRRGAESPGPHH